jgi:hypothetical protein
MMLNPLGLREHQNLPADGRLAHNTKPGRKLTLRPGRRVPFRTWLSGMGLGFTALPAC